MHHVFSVLVIALANNIDNVGVRIAYSLRGIRIGTIVNLWIALITFAITLLAAGSGTVLPAVLGKRVCSVVGMVLLTGIGLWMMLEPHLKNLRHGGDSRNPLGARLLPMSRSANHDGEVGFKEGTVLGVALSINNVGGGLTAGMIGLDPFLVGLLSAAVSFGALWAGNRLASICIRFKLYNKVAYLAGALLIAIGIDQLL